MIYKAVEIKQFSQVEELLNNMDKKGYFLRECDIKALRFIFERYPHIEEKKETKKKRSPKKESIKNDDVNIPDVIENGPFSA